MNWGNFFELRQFFAPSQVSRFKNYFPGCSKVHLEHRLDSHWWTDTPLGHVVMASLSLQSSCRRQWHGTVDWPVVVLPAAKIHWIQCITGRPSLWWHESVRLVALCTRRQIEVAAFRIIEKPPLPHPLRDAPSLVRGILFLLGRLCPRSGLTQSIVTMLPIKSRLNHKCIYKTVTSLLEPQQVRLTLK